MTYLGAECDDHADHIPNKSIHPSIHPSIHQLTSAPSAMIMPTTYSSSVQWPSPSTSSDEIRLWLSWLRRAFTRSRSNLRCQMEEFIMEEFIGRVAQ
jgi:hypothetical protein